MDYFEDDGVKFVGVVQKYPCLWDSNKYSTEVIESAWKAVSEEMAESPSICKKRWYNTQRQFKRCIKNGRLDNSRVPYYLAKHLEFLLPHLDHYYTGCTENYFNENMTNVETVMNDQPSNTGNRIDEPETVEISDEESEETKTSSSKDTTPINMQILNRKQISNTVNNSGVFVQCRVSKKKTSIGKVNGNEAFFNSLLPYLREMTGKQNRRFRQKVVALIDEILEDADIPKVILHPISAKDSSASLVPELSTERHFRSVTEDRHQ